MPTNPIRFQPNGLRGTDLAIWDPVLIDEAADVLPTQRGELFYEDEASGVSVGIWESTPFTGVMAPYPVHEFMIVLEGAVTIITKAGDRTVIEAGQSFLLPKGLECRWHQDVPVKKYFMIFDKQDEQGITSPAPSLVVDGAAPLSSIAVNPSDPLLGPPPVLHARTAFENATGAWRIGVWQTGPYHRSKGPFPRYELMHILEGEASITDQRGNVETYGPGETLFIPKGTECNFLVGEHLRKIYCILDLRGPA